MGVMANNKNDLRSKTLYYDALYLHLIHKGYSREQARLKVERMLNRQML